MMLMYQSGKIFHLISMVVAFLRSKISILLLRGYSYQLLDQFKDVSQVLK